MPSNGRGGRPGVYTTWTTGNLNFVDHSGHVICTFDGVNRALTFANGATLHASTGAAPIVSGAVATLAAQNVTPTAAQLLGGIVEHATATGNGTCTLDTAAHLDAAIPNVATGDTFDVVLANTGGFTSTITTNTGLTLKGTLAVPTGKNAILTFIRTGVAAWIVYCQVSA
ncbi:MAG TPA: hypothetical protein VFA70_04275 [Dehalococcoidia bacterium]|nr:hypothetical protein [Dehalococcoidia bacterium]